MARTSYNNGQSFQTNQKHSLFCSVHLAFSSFCLARLCAVCVCACISVCCSYPLVGVPCNAFWLAAATSKGTNFHSFSSILYSVHFISVTFYLKIYVCYSVSFVYDTAFFFSQHFLGVLLSLLYGNQCRLEGWSDSV